MKDEDKEEWIRVIIETPGGSANKYAWNEKLNLLELKNNLPLGCHFPYDFGFIPGTRAPDGDPLDIIVLSDAFAYPGIMLTCKVIGVIKAKQKEADGKVVENDRIVAVSPQSHSFSRYDSIKDIDKKLTEQLVAFFVFYEKQLGKEFLFKGMSDAAVAIKIINSFIEDKNIKQISETSFQLRAREK